MMDRDSARLWCEKAGIRWQEAADAQALAEELARCVAQALQQAIDTQGMASLVVSGGSTPAPVFRNLSKTPIQWSKVAVTLADERWVPPGHADSNESLVRETLLVGLASAARFIPLYRDALPEAAIIDVARDVRAMVCPFTVTILGMGGDGHTASLFPDAPKAELHAAMQLENADTVALLNPPSVDQMRISLTRAALLNSAQRIVHITGEGKRQVLAQALIDSAAEGELPGEYTEGMKPVIGLLTSMPEAASVFWSP